MYIERAPFVSNFYASVINVNSNVSLYSFYSQVFEKHSPFLFSSFVVYLDVREKCLHISL